MTVRNDGSKWISVQLSLAEIELSELAKRQETQNANAEKHVELVRARLALSIYCGMAVE